MIFAGGDILPCYQHIGVPRAEVRFHGDDSLFQRPGRGEAEYHPHRPKTNWRRV